MEVSGWKRMSSIFWVAGVAEDPSPGLRPYAPRSVGPGRQPPRHRHTPHPACGHHLPGPRGEGGNPVGRTRRRVFSDRPQRIEPVDDEAPQPGIGAVAQQMPDTIGLPEPDQSNRRPCLSLGQRILALFRARSVFAGDRTSGDLGLERGDGPWPPGALRQGRDSHTPCGRRS